MKNMNMKNYFEDGHEVISYNVRCAERRLWKTTLDIFQEMLRLAPGAGH